MAMVIRVRFKRAAKLYDFDPNGLDLHNGMSVVTETARGVELGECMSGIMDFPLPSYILYSYLHYILKFLCFFQFPI